MNAMNLRKFKNPILWLETEISSFFRCFSEFLLSSLLPLREAYNALRLPVFFFFLLLFFFQYYPEYRGIRSKKTILQTTKQLIQYMVLEIQLQSLKYTTVIRICKNLSNFPFLSRAITRREQFVDVNNPLQTVFKHFKLYILTQIVRKINYYIAGKYFGQYLQRNKQNSIDFMNALYLQCERVGGGS